MLMCVKDEICCEVVELCYRYPWSVDKCRCCPCTFQVRKEFPNNQWDKGGLCLNRLSATIVYCCWAWQVEVIMHVEGYIVSCAVSVVHVDGHGVSYVVNYRIFYCYLEWQIWIVLYVEGCWVSSAKSVVHVDVCEGWNMLWGSWVWWSTASSIGCE